MKGIASQAEPIAVIILTVVGLALALSVWAWVNASIGSVSRDAILTQYLAFERAREYINLLASGETTSGQREYVVELLHITVTERRWFAFILLVNRADQPNLVDPVATAALNEGYYAGRVKIYVLQPSTTGSYILNATAVRNLTLSPRDVILVDGRDLTAYGLNATNRIALFMVDEYFTGIGDPTPQAVVSIRIDPRLIPENGRIVLVTLTSFNGHWYEVARLILP